MLPDTVHNRRGILKMMAVVLSINAISSTIIFWISDMAGPTFGSLLFRVSYDSVILLGAFCMYFQKSYEASLVAAIMSCIPICSPHVIFGIPFGVTAIIALSSRTARESFVCKRGEVPLWDDHELSERKEKS